MEYKKKKKRKLVTISGGTVRGFWDHWSEVPFWVVFVDYNKTGAKDPSLWHPICYIHAF